MTEALIGTCILAITTVIFVWVCSEYQIYNNEHSAEEKLNTPRLSSWFAAQRMRFWFAVDDARENAEKNNIPARFVHGPAEETIEKLWEEEKIARHIWDIQAGNVEKLKKA